METAWKQPRRWRATAPVVRAPPLAIPTQMRGRGSRPGRHGGRPQVITDDMLHTVLRRRELGESVEDIAPDLIIATGKRKGQNPSVSSIYRALAEHEKARAYPEAIQAAHADFAALAGLEHSANEIPRPRPARVHQRVNAELRDRLQSQHRS